MERPKTKAVVAFWHAFRAASGIADEDFEVVMFDHTAEVGDELAALVLRGQKRATASLAASFVPGSAPPPVLGGHVVVVDGSGNPACIFRTAELRIGPMDSVTDAFAWIEGEGDRSRAWWLAAHRKFFTREAARLGIAMHEGIATVFERFVVVWPPEAADRES